MQTQDREAWLEERRKGIGGSDAAVILGINPWKTPYTLWAEKTGLIHEDDISSNDRVAWGNILEPVIAAEFQMKHPELLLSDQNLTAVSQQHPWMRGNVDRWVDEPDGNRCILEIKTGHNLKDWKSIPQHYVAQVQHYMAVTGANKAYLVCLVNGYQWVERLVLRDEKYIETLIEQEREFWEAVTTKTPPKTKGEIGNEQSSCGSRGIGIGQDNLPEWA